MATIGYLKLMFGADTGPLKKGCAEARSSISSVGDAGSRMGSLLATAGKVGAAGVGAAGVALAALAKNSADNMDRIHDAAERVGTSTEAFSKLEHAAKMSGVSSELLEGSLEKMQLRLGEVAETGKGPAADALKKLGVSAADLANEDPAAAFHTLVTAIGGIENPTKRATAAVDLFGKAGQGLAGLAAQGAGGLAALEAEADKLGVTVNDLDAAKIGEMYDAFDRITGAIGGVGNVIAAKAAPYVAALADKVLEVGLAASNMGEYFSTAFDYVSGAATKAGEYLDSFGVNTEAAWSLAGSAVDGVGAGIDFLVDSFFVVEGAILKTTGAITDLGSMGLKVFNFLGEGVGGFVDGFMSSMQSAASYMEDWLDFLTRPITDLLKALGVLPKAFSVNLVSPLIQASRDITAGAGGAVTGLTKGWIKDLEASAATLRAAADDQLSKVGSGSGDGAKMLRDAGKGVADAVKDSGVIDYLTNAVPAFWGGLASDFMKTVDAVNSRAADSEAAGAKFRGLTAGGAGDLGAGGKAAKFAGALDVGSKEGYSAILTAQGLAGGDKSGATTAKNTTALVAEAKAQTVAIKDLRDSLMLAGGGDLIGNLNAV